ncbi:heterodisulfide reductase-related iron-sulfur binding cluster [Sphingobacterium sp. IITKGP-BTPF85]|uniref:heterodisulfide reductase-related iron-sulfur binding cluster n=1 Tax=Sphingobacterium sp. IITKGP-BTPF85 TaxID=1338009 RepID=UPI00041A82E3|nr:heterodisulfide reductase-related iron-sulfur binding cluster [Sphingobacterium sp. IITKGP-BTPF85]
MRVGLFIPCYIDAIYPEVGIATLELLERLGVEVVVPLNQTCCGQPMGNEGDQKMRLHQSSFSAIILKVLITSLVRQEAV